MACHHPDALACLRIHWFVPNLFISLNHLRIHILINATLDPSDPGSPARINVHHVSISHASIIPAIPRQRPCAQLVSSIQKEYVALTQMLPHQLEQKLLLVGIKSVAQLLLHHLPELTLVYGWSQHVVIVLVSGLEWILHSMNL